MKSKLYWKLAMFIRGVALRIDLIGNYFFDLALDEYDNKRAASSETSDAREDKRATGKKSYMNAGCVSYTNAIR
jgi:hypothetical protein